DAAVEFDERGGAVEAGDVDVLHRSGRSECLGMRGADDAHAVRVAGGQVEVAEPAVRRGENQGSGSRLAVGEGAAVQAAGEFYYVRVDLKRPVDAVQVDRVDQRELAVGGGVGQDQRIRADGTGGGTGGGVEEHLAAGTAEVHGQIAAARADPHRTS